MLDEIFEEIKEEYLNVEPLEYGGISTLYEKHKHYHIPLPPSTPH